MVSLESSAFQRAFAALSYLLGRREAELLEPFAVPHEEARSLARRLCHPERERRAEALARELAQLSIAVDARAIQ